MTYVGALFVEKACQCPLSVAKLLNILGKVSLGGVPGRAIKWIIYACHRRSFRQLSRENARLWCSDHSGAAPPRGDRRRTGHLSTRRLAGMLDYFLVTIDTM